ncbi:MAG: polysaccharide biosynthesis/export family protein [Pirellulales bacterium]
MHIPGDFRLWILAAYGIGVVLMALWSLMGLVAVQRLLRSARPAPPECRILLRAVGGPRSDRVRLLVSSRAAQPCAVVSRSATIVLPEQLVADADPRALQWALAHEWSHVEHGDLATWTASAIVRWFYFYQPLVWWLRGQLQLSQDFVADAAAARLGETPEDYAEFLTTSSFTRPTLAAGLGIGGRIADLRRRVIMLVERRRALESRSPRRWNLLALPLAVLVLAATAGLAQEESRPEAAANKPETGGGRLEDKEPATAKDEAPAPAYEVAPFGSPPVISESVQDARSKADSLIPKTSRKPKHKQGAQPQSARIPDAMVEQELMKDQFLTSLVRERAELVIKLAKLKAKPGTAKSAINDLNAEINSLDQEIDEYKANLRPRVVELLAAEVARGQPAQDEQPLLPQPSPNVPRPQAAPPAGPRKIAPGDTLTIDVMDNVDSLKLPGLRLLMRTGATATVAGDGKLSLGSIYGNVDVAGETLDRAEASIAEKLETMTKMRYQTPKGISQDLVDDALNHMQINVRLSFANAGGPVTAAAPTRLHANTPPPPATAVSTTTILPGDVLNIDVEPPEADVSVRKPAVVEQDGNVALGVRFGRVNVGGKTLAEAEDLIEKSIAEIYRDPQVQVTYAQQGTISTAAPARRMDNDKPSHELLQEVQRLNARIDQLQKMLEKERRQHYQPYPTPTDDPLIVPSEGPNVKPPPLEPPSDDPFTPQVRPQPEDAPTRPEPKPNIEPGPAPESKPKLKPEPQPPLQPEPN